MRNRSRARWVFASEALGARWPFGLTRMRIGFAIAYADRAIAIAGKGEQTARRMKSGCLCLQGRYVEALELLSAMLRQNTHDISRDETNAQGTLLIELSWIAMHLEDERMAARYLEQAEQYLSSDANRQYCAGADKDMGTRAVGGYTDEARTHIDAVKSRALRYPDIKYIQVNFLSLAGRGAFMIGDFAESRRMWQQCLDMNTMKVYSPMTHFCT